VSSAGGHVKTAFQNILPSLRGYDQEGKEVDWIDEGADSSRVVRLVAVWDPPVEMVANLLAGVKGTKVTKEDVLRVAEKSPQALEALKKAGSDFRGHFLRFLDPVALRRSPDFNRVAQRYKVQLRAAIDEQQRLIRDARAATRRVNQILGERDEELATLDPGYTPKRATAASALRGFGIDLGEALESADPEGHVAAGVLDDLDF
jgi:hypothetical protein